MKNGVGREYVGQSRRGRGSVMGECETSTTAEQISWVRVRDRQSNEVVCVPLQVLLKKEERAIRWSKVRNI
jgi:hypothetical protein